MNEKTVTNSFPMIRIASVLDTLSGSMYFSTMDLKSAFFQVNLNEQSRPLTAFATEDGLYEFNRLMNLAYVIARPHFKEFCNTSSEILPGRHA